MTEQIQTTPKFFDVKKHFGPFFANVVLADDVTNAMIKMTDKIIDDKKSESHGQSLAGVIDKELRIYKSDMNEFGVDQMLESCLRSYVIHCAKQHGSFKENWTYESMVNSAWVVSQYENEYNPIHNHTGCDISGVIYLKTPNVKGRRNINSKKGKTDHDSDITFKFIKKYICMTLKRMTIKIMFFHIFFYNYDRFFYFIFWFLFCRLVVFATHDMHTSL